MTTKTKVPKKLVDEYGSLKEQANKLKKRIEELQKIFDDHETQNGETIMGHCFVIQYSVTPTERLDTDLIRETMSADWLKNVTIPGERCTYKPIRIKPDKK